MKTVRIPHTAVNDMAATRIWSVKTTMHYTIEYVEDLHKTCAIVTEYDGQEVILSDIENVIAYATRDDKTLAEDAVHIKRYVTGINCSTDTALEEMLLTKKKFRKEGGILAWHAYQSFKPGEVTPDEAHEIGIRLAQKIWGDRFQVVVTTHLDKEHLHNHFVVNSVSYLDGYKFYDKNHWYYNVMRKESDALCREYGKSVIDTENSSAMPHGAYRAKQQGKYTLEEIVKEDIDRIIRTSGSMGEFFSGMRKSGYTVHAEGKYVRVIPYGRKPIRIDRRWGQEYSLEGIEARIRYNVEHGLYREKEGKRYYAKNVPKAGHKLTGYRALYVRYLFLLGALPQKRRGYTNRQMHYLMREDLLKLDTMIAEMKFLRQNGIETDVSLDFEKAKRQNMYNGLSERRSKLRNKIRRAPEEQLEPLKEELKNINSEMKVLRRELFYCNDIRERSERMKSKMEKVNELSRNDPVQENKQETGQKEGGTEYGRSK